MANAQAARDKTKKLRSQRLAKENSEASTGVWTVHYFDKRLNRDGISREFTAEDAAMHQACDLMRQGMRVDYVRGPAGRRIGSENDGVVQIASNAGQTPGRSTVASIPKNVGSQSVTNQTKLVRCLLTLLIVNFAIFVSGRRLKPSDCQTRS